MPYTVPPLPYAYDALEPYVDEATMRLHHDQHHQAYVDKANAALEGTALADRPVDELLRSLDQVPGDSRTAVRNNAGGHANHTAFWETMTPGGPAEPPHGLAEGLSRVFGSVAGFKDALSRAATAHFGSGWAWLVHDGSGLAIATTANQDSPITHGATPLLGIDLWEHAYYLRYENRRPQYVEAWWNVVNWDIVAGRLAAL